MDIIKNKEKEVKLKNVFFWRKIFVVFLVLVLVASLVLFFRSRKRLIFEKESFVSPESSLLKDSSFGLGGNYVREGSIGEPFYLGELVNRAGYQKSNQQSVLELVSAVKENGDKNNKELKGGEKIVLNILFRNPENYPLVNIKIAGVLRGIVGDKNLPTSFLNDFFLITSNSFDLAGGKEKKISFLYTIPENIPPGNYSLELGATEGNNHRYLAGFTFYRNWGWKKPPKGSLIFSVLDGDKSFGLVSKDGDLDFEIINKENKFSLKSSWNIVSYPQVGVRFKMFNDSQEAKNFSVRYDLINLAGGLFMDFNKDLDKIAERRSFTVKPGSTEEVFHEFNLDDYIERAQKSFNDKDFSWADNIFGFSSLQILIEGEGRKYIVYFPLFREFKGYAACLTVPNISKFPIRKGETVDLFTGFLDLRLSQSFQNSKEKQVLANENNVSRIELLLKDKEGGEIGRAVYVGKIDGSTKGWRNKIKAPKDLDYLELTASIYNNQGKLDKTTEEIYDCKKIEGVACLRD